MGLFLLLFLAMHPVDLQMGKPVGNCCQVNDDAKRVVFRFVSENEDFWADIHDKPLTLQLSPWGHFLCMDGCLLENVGDLMSTDGKPLYVIVDVASETPLLVLIESLNKLKSAAPPSGSTFVFIRTKGLSAK